jgi:PPIC-type PPIASE domain
MRLGFLTKIAREPLIHFLLLGATLFAAYSVLHRTGDTDVLDIVVSAGQLEHLAEGFARVNQRPPTPIEMQGLIGDYVRGEVYNREALALGLDRGDPVIRNRLRQKMQFLSEDVAALAPPSDEQLRIYLQAHADTFRLEQLYTFRQMYFNPDHRHEHLASDIEQALQALRAGDAGTDLLPQGDPFLLDREFLSLPATEVSKLFGDSFTKRLAEVPVGTWQGPIESGYGEHLVFLQARSTGRMPTLEEARAAVSRDLMNEARLRANDTFYRNLLKRYHVIIEPPSADDMARTMSAAR